MKCMLCVAHCKSGQAGVLGVLQGVGVSTKPTRLTAKGSRAGNERVVGGGKGIPSHSTGEFAGNSSRSGALKNHCDAAGGAKQSGNKCRNAKCINMIRGWATEREGGREVEVGYCSQAGFTALIERSRAVAPAGKGGPRSKAEQQRT